MLKRSDWRALQWTEDAASEPIQLELLFARRRANILNKTMVGMTRLTSPTRTTPKAKSS
jgi:hypothetical protein